MVISARNYLYNQQILKATLFKMPTIVVGNLSVGGTGKTPQIEYLIRLLQNRYNTAVLSRGYKRKTKGFLLASKYVTPVMIGDEPYQYYRKFPKITVAVDADRTHGIQQLKQLKSKPELVLLDDAFQHRKIQGGFNILLTAYNDLYVDATLLPVGNLREQKSGAQRAQVIIVTKCPRNLPEEKQAKIIKKLRVTASQKVFFTSVAYDTILKGANPVDLNTLKNTKILLLTGIANPNPLCTFLKEKKIEFTHLKYPDHHHFTARDIAKIKLHNKALNTIILTTEKDYVRIFDSLKGIYYISIKTTFINRENDFNNLINNYVEQSTRNR